ncbi:hypothetical protein CHUAL_002746 [Chamberlinius hualienensis]
MGLKLMSIVAVALLFIGSTKGGLFPALKDVNGGSTCMGCTFVVALARNLMTVYDFNSTEAIDYFIDCFPEPYKAALWLIEPTLVDMLTGPINANATADVACYTAGFCLIDPPDYHYCHLYPVPEGGMEHSVQHMIDTFDITPIKNMCDIPEFKDICNLLNFGDPVVVDDPDGDNFTTHPTLRGYAWRGQDCAEDNSDGVNPDTGNAYEDELCGDQSNYGVIYIGDSIGAHFHIPPDWIRANVVTSDLFVNLTFIAANELDWPHITWPVVVHSPTNSIYWRMRDRNLCNHRDYQNLAFNGAKSTTAMRGVETMSRDEGRDKPAIVIYAEFGNDICGSDTGAIDDMTPVQVFHDSVVETLNYMDTRLPFNSHVFLVGLVNGSYLYSIVRGHIHPIGEIKNDVSYDQIYDYFGCMQVVCPAWTNVNITEQTTATEYAVLLSNELASIAATSSFNRFDVHYVPSPMDQGVALWDGPLIDLIEPVDGLHPSKNGQDLFAEVSWRIMTSQYPDIIGPVNPNNDKIRELFGDQGGH